MYTDRNGQRVTVKRTRGGFLLIYSDGRTVSIGR
jgi:hypothetical protein